MNARMEEAVEDLKKGLSKEEVMTKHNLNPRQINYCLGRSKPDSKPDGDKKRVNTERLPEAPTQEKEDIDLPSKQDLIPEAKTIIKEPEAKKDLSAQEDPDLCAECDRQGKKTILKKGQTYCPECGCELSW